MPASEGLRKNIFPAAAAAIGSQLVHQPPITLHAASRGNPDKIRKKLTFDFQ